MVPMNVTAGKKVWTKSPHLPADVFNKPSLNKTEFGQTLIHPRGVATLYHPKGSYNNGAYDYGLAEVTWGRWN